MINIVTIAEALLGTSKKYKIKYKNVIAEIIYVKI